jgi:hypothetical protein
MKKVIIFALAAALIGGAAYANFCARDTVPAATLLVPYIVVDMQPDGLTPNPDGYTTILQVTNVSSTKQIIHVTVYNAWSVGVVDFDEVLSGYDMWRINFRDLVAGNFALFDTGSPTSGFWSGPVGIIGNPFGPTTNNNAVPTTILPNPQDIDYTSNTGCGFPWAGKVPIATANQAIVAGLSAPLQVFSTEDASCFSRPPHTVPMAGTWIAGIDPNSQLFFYATIDTVSVCSSLFPDQDPAYWTTPIANEHNVLVGNIYYLNSTANASESVPAVSIEAQSQWLNSESYGFYSHLRSNLGLNAADDREPLGQAFSFDYFNSNGITTNVEVWKNQSEFDIPTVGDVSACLRYLYYAFDMDENSQGRTISTCPSGLCYGNAEPNVLPFQTQSVPVTSANFDGLESGDGWMLLVFDPAIPYAYSGAADYDVQAWVAAKYSWGTYTTSVEGATLSNTYCFGPAQQLPALNTYDGSTIFY